MAYTHPARFERCTFSGSDQLLPEIVFAGSNTWTRTRPQNLGGHSHPGCWEICFLFRGVIECWSGEQLMTIRANEMLVIPPAEKHSGIDTVLHRTDVCWLSLVLAHDRPLPGLSPTEHAAIVDGFAAIGAPGASRRFPVDGTVAPAFATILDEGRQRRPLGGTIARAALHQVLAGTVRSYAAWRESGEARERRSPAVQQAVALLRQRLAESVSMAALARAVGLGRSRLHERFVTEVGLSPAEFHTRLRVDRAKELLPRATNAEVARTLGFATPRHFAEVFKRATGSTPAGWRSRSGSKPAASS